jgi:WD40 repeat protein
MIQALSISPDGRTLAFSKLGQICLVEVKSGRETLRLAGHRWFTDSSCFSPDGKILASGGRDGSIRFWDVGTGRELAEQKCAAATTWPTKYVAYFPGGKSLFAFATDDCRVIDLTSRQITRQWKQAREPAALSPDGKTVALGASDTRMHLWDAVTGREIRSFDLVTEERVQHATAGRSAAFSPDGKMLAVGDMTNRLHVWNVSTGKELYRSPPFHGWLTCLAFSPDGKTLAVGAWFTIRLLDTATWKSLLPLHSHSEQVADVRFVGDGKAIVSVGGDNAFTWSLPAGRQIQRFPITSLYLDACYNLSRDGAVLAAKNGDAVRVWNTKSGKEVQRFPATSPANLALSADGKMLAIGEQDSNIRIVEVEKGNELAKWSAHPPDGSIRLLFSPDAKTLSSGGYDRSLRLWTISGKELWHRGPEAENWPDIPFRFSPDGKTLISTNRGEAIAFWEVATGKEKRRVVANGLELALSSDDRLLAVTGRTWKIDNGVMQGQGGHAVTLRLWNLAEGKQGGPYGLHPDGCGDPAFSPDGRLLAVDTGGCVILFEVASGKEVRRFHGHEAGAVCLSFSSDGRLLASGSFDLTALVWDVTGLMESGRYPSKQLGSKEMDALWTDLASSEAQRAYTAVWKFAAAPDQASAFLATRIHPAQAVSEDKLRRLIAKLDSVDFAERQEATRELEDSAELAEDALHHALEKKSSPEFRRRADQLLSKLGGPTSDPQRLRPLRAVAVLEYAGTQRAKDTLQALARGYPGALLTEGAKSSLLRLRQQ